MVLMEWVEGVLKKKLKKQITARGRLSADRRNSPSSLKRLSRKIHEKLHFYFGF
jgi:hypothetical protein